MTNSEKANIILQEIEYYLQFDTLQCEYAEKGILKVFVLVHAGIENFSKTKDLAEYNIEELIFYKPSYYLKYFDDKYLVTGHTPTRYIREEELNLFRGIVDKNGHKYDKIYKLNNHIAIDCSYGCGVLLCAIRVDN